LGDEAAGKAGSLICTGGLQEAGGLGRLSQTSRCAGGLQKAGGLGRPSQTPRCAGGLQEAGGLGRPSQTPRCAGGLQKARGLGRLSQTPRCAGGLQEAPACIRVCVCWILMYNVNLGIALPATEKERATTVVHGYSEF
jgi:hypothetical protein